MIDGLLVALEPANLLLMVAGVAGGVIIGCLPGLTATMGTALLVPFTFTMEPASGLVMLGALYVGAMFGDAVPAILVNIPGTPSSMATAFDGHPLAQQGRGQHALVAACFSSAVGALVGGFALLVLSPPLASAALAFGPPEFFWLGAFALTIVGTVVGDSFLRGICGGLLGLLLSTIGIAASGGANRFTFGHYELSAGISLPVALIGLFAVPQLIKLVQERRQKTQIAPYISRPGVLRASLPEIARPIPLLRASAIGTVTGILPGSGPSLANLVSYNEAVRWSRDRRSFGKGNIQGVVASETAGNAAAPTSMVPLLTLGIPGSNVAAVLLGALLFHGLRPGAELFEDAPEVVYGFIWAMIIGGFIVFGLGRLMTPLLVRVIQTPISVLVPAIAALTVVGSFSVRNSIFDVYLMLILGLLGYGAVRLGIPVATIALGLILGPIVESGLNTSLGMADNSGWLDVFVLRPICLVLIAMTALSILWTVYARRNERRDALVSKAEAED